MRASIRLAVALATLSLAAPARAAGVTPSGATPAQREEAQSHFARAHDLYVARKLDLAHDEFEKSYAIVASPNSLLFVARSDRDRGKLVAAYAEYGRTVAEATEHASDDPRYAKTADAAREERDALASQIAFVTIAIDRATPETTVTIGSERFGHAQWGEAVPIAPGDTDVVVTTPGKADAHQRVTLAAGERRTLALDAGPDTVAAAPPPMTAPPKPAEAPDDVRSRSATRTYAYVAAGIGGVGLATFAVFGLMSSSTYSDLQSQCHGPCSPAQSDEISKGKTQQTIADVGLGVGLVGAAAAVGLFVMSLPSKSESVSIVAGPTWAGVRGAF
jgi:hypothetical protein